MPSLIERNGIYYIQYCVSGKARRVSTQTESLQLAKEKLRQFESAQLRGHDNPLPTRTPIADVLERYVAHIRTHKTANSAQKDVYYLRDMFGVICPALTITSRNVTSACRKKPPRPDATQDRRRRAVVIEAPCFEQITSTNVSAFITGQVQSRGHAPKTANHYRQILCRVFNWAMNEGGIRMPGDKNPVVQVKRYKERAPEIRFLTLLQIDEQLDAISSEPKLHAMVATMIYAGLRREELLWLRTDDVDMDSGSNGVLRIRAKTVHGRTWQPKTKVNRVVPISSTLRAHLTAYAARVGTSETWYFPSPAGKLYDVDNFSADPRKANSAASLPWTCLDFRHTFGSQLAIEGESLYKISRLLGNSQQVCQKHYAALTLESLADSVEFPSGRVNRAAAVEVL
ncbi:MAG: tyrosine-type recombinase/integrase [Tepidisphaeraceae bacterium]